MNKKVEFLFPNGSLGEGTIVDKMSNNRYLIKITKPKNNKWANNMIDVDEQDISEFYTGELPPWSDGVIERHKKFTKPKLRKCKCKK